MTKHNWAKGSKKTKLVRVESDLHKRAKDIAERERMSLRAWLEMVLIKYMEIKC
jgi:predicted HicB family RNase H-like nuclease